MISVALDVRRGRNPFFVVMAIAILVTVVLGFAPTFYLRSVFHPDKGLPIVVRVHGFALSAWIVLFLVQTVLIVRGSNVLHRRLGHAVAGWWVDSGASSPVVLLVHGVRADRLAMVSRAQLLIKHGFSVLLIDLQAHGETPGDAITLGYRESRDVTAARDWIGQTAPGRKIGVIGVSLGGASVLLAPQPVGFDAVVLEAVYPRIANAVEDRLRIRVGPLAPLLAPVLLMQLQPRLGISQSELEPIRFIGQMGAPVLVVAGSRDEHTTLAESKELFAAAVEPKAMWIVKGAKHQDFLRFDPKGYEERVVAFLMERLMGAAVIEQ